MSDRTPKTDFHNAVTTLCQEPIQVCQASPISFGHRIVSNSISVQIIADHDGMFHGAEKSPQISRYTLCRGLIRLCIGGEHLIGQQRRDAVQQKNTAMIRLFQANRQVSSLFQGYKSLARPCRSVDAYPLQFIGVTWGLHGCYIITRASF